MNIQPDNEAIRQLLEDYKQHIKETKLADELYKWKLIQKFQGRPNLQAPDLAAEITSIDYSNLIYQMARAVAKHIVTERPEPYREALAHLFDETTRLQERIDHFRSEIEVIIEEWGQR